MPVSHDPNARGVGWPCREAERARAARAVAAPAADAGAPKAKTVKRDPSQPRKIGPVYVHILDQVPARRASGDDACAALAFICIPYRVSKSWRLTYLTATLTGLAALYRYPLLSPPQGECPQQTEPLLICSCQIHLKVNRDPCGFAASAMAFARQRMFDGGKVRSSEMLAPTHQQTKAAGLLSATRGPATKFV